MPKISAPASWWVTAAAVTVASAVLAGLAGAQAVERAQPDADGTLTACYGAGAGQLRLRTDDHPECRTNEREVEWSATSPRAPLTVGVDSFGNRAAGTADATVAHPATGKYVVTFGGPLPARGTIECATLATLSRGMSGAFNASVFDAPPGEISTFPAFTDLASANQVVVSTYDSAGGAKDQSFWLVLHCP